MSAPDYILGLLYLGLTLTAVGAVAVVVVRRRMAYLRGSLRVLAYAVLVTAGLTLVNGLPAMLGLLGRASVLLVAGVLLWIVALFVRERRPGEGRNARPMDGAFRNRTVASAIAAAATLVVVALGVAELMHTIARPLQSPDLLSYDLPTVARWIQARSLWPITELFPLQTHGTYPQNGDLVLLALILPWRNDAFVRLLEAAYLPLASLSVYALARELRAPRASAVTFAALFASIPVAITTIDIVLPDTLMVAMFGAGTVFLLRGTRAGRADELLLAGLGLAFALGAKWYGLSAVLAVLAVWALSASLSPRVRAGFARHATLVVALTAIGAFWLLRNWVQAGDPFYPQRVSVFGTTIFGAPPDAYRQLAGFTLAHYLGTWGVWRRDLLPAFGSTLAAPGIVALVAVPASVLTGLFAIRRRRHESDVVAVGVAAAALLIVAAYMVTPYSAFGLAGHPTLTSFNVRYVMPALVLGASLGAWLAGRAGRLRIVFEGVAIVAIVQGIHDGVHPPGILVLVTGVGLLSVGLVVWLLRERSVPLAALAATALLICLGGYVLERRFNEHRYLGIDPTYDYVLTHAAPGTRIALTGPLAFNGLSPAWPLYGLRLENQVFYLGPLSGDHRTEYQSESTWTTALRAGHYGMLLVARGHPIVASAADEGAWAVRDGLTPVASSPRFVLYRLPGCQCR
jgi:Dolichyl-phosphate-mannose-protein mannosyltransferase